MSNLNVLLSRQAYSPQTIEFITRTDFIRVPSESIISFTIVRKTFFRLEQSKVRCFRRAYHCHTNCICSSVVEPAFMILFALVIFCVEEEFHVFAGFLDAMSCSEYKCPSFFIIDEPSTKRITSIRSRMSSTTDAHYKHQY